MPAGYQAKAEYAAGLAEEEMKAANESEFTNDKLIALARAQTYAQLATTYAILATVPNREKMIG